MKNATVSRTRLVLTRFAYFALLLTAASGTYAALSNAQLLSRAASAADQHDWLGTSQHLFAYVQRDPERMLSDPAHAEAINQALAAAEHNARQPAAGIDGKFDCPECPPELTKPDMLIVNVPDVAPPRLDARSLATLRKFVGSYEGRNDGRRARLIIRMPNESHPALDITLTDVDRNVTFRGRHTSTPAGAEFAHILRDVSLERTAAGEGEGKDFALLLLHTWDNDFISGVSVWRGREFGVSFQRVQ